MAGWGLLTAAHAQTSSSSNNLTATPATDRIVPFRLSEAGVTRQVEWGADIAWLDENNVRRSAAFMGKDNLDIVRTSFQATYALVDGDLQQGQKRHHRHAHRHAEVGQAGRQAHAEQRPPAHRPVV